MEVDWEVEIGAGAPVIEAGWTGFIDLRREPERVTEISEAAEFPPLAALLLALNSPDSPVWTSKCDVWMPDTQSMAHALAIYIDILPREGAVFAEWSHAEAFCRDYVARLAAKAVAADASEYPIECMIDLVIRQALAGEVEGFGITAYLSVEGREENDAAKVLASLMAGIADALPQRKSPATVASKLQ